MADTVFINFKGGIINPHKLEQILQAASKIKILYVHFGLRQQLLVDMENYNVPIFTKELDLAEIEYEINENKYPNIISSYPAEDVFIRNTWLNEIAYKTIFDSFNNKHSLKINICDSNQSFTPMLTGNINWIASNQVEHYWHLVIRFPKTNVTFEWNKICHSNNLSAASFALEKLIIANKAKFIDNELADGKELFALFDEVTNLNTLQEDVPVKLAPFNLPYYEGLNKYGDNYWLGIYRRDEQFSVSFLKKLCKICSEQQVQLCCTSWKTLMVKSIEEKNREVWSNLLEEFQINVRHAANELNFQVEDNSLEALQLKNYLVKHLSSDDMRTFGVCIGIKTKKKSEIFSSILVRRRYLIDFLGIRFIKVYDVLCAKGFNPNERTEEIFTKDNPIFFVPEQVRRSILKYYKFKAKQNNIAQQEEMELQEEVEF
jgi:hypothetical protein